MWGEKKTMSRFHELDSTRFTFKEKEYAVDIGFQGDKLSFTSCFPEGIQIDLSLYSSFKVYDKNDVEYFGGLWMTENLLPRLKRPFPEPVMVERMWNGTNYEH